MVAESAVKTGSYGSVNAILPLLEHLESEGFELRTILDRVGIPDSALEDTRTRFPKGKFEALWRVAIEVTGDPAIALRVSTMVKPNTLGIIGYLASASESPRNAFELVKGLTPLLWEDFECELESDGEVAFIRCNTGGSPRGEPLHHRVRDRADDHHEPAARSRSLRPPRGALLLLRARVRGGLRAHPAASHSLRRGRGRGPLPPSR